MLSLAEMYRTGLRGVRQDKGNALEWTHKSVTELLRQNAEC